MSEIKYILTSDEVLDALLLTKRIKPYKNKSIIQSALAGILAIMFLIDIIKNPGGTQGYIALVACILIIFFVWIMPKKIQQRTVKSATTDEEILIEIKPDTLTVKIEKNGVCWDIEKLMVANVLENENHYAITLTDGRIMPIPKRAVDENSEADLKKVLVCFDG